jgi:hypothetical protein
MPKIRMFSLHELADSLAALEAIQLDEKSPTRRSASTGTNSREIIFEKIGARTTFSKRANLTPLP